MLLAYNTNGFAHHALPDALDLLTARGYRGVQIHVIYVGEYGGEDMEKLAHENGGVFVSIGG